MSLNTSNELKRFFKIMIIFGAVGILSIAFSFITGLSACIIYGITGIPCPSCGMTRATLYFIKGDFKNAFIYHPLFWYPALIIILFLPFKKLKNIEKYMSKIFIIMSIVLLIVWVWRMLTMFPHTEPMVFNKLSFFKWEKYK